MTQDQPSRHFVPSTHQDPPPDAPAPVDRSVEYRRLPAVDALLKQPAIALLVAEHGSDRIAHALRALLDQARTAIGAGAAAPAPETWPARLAAYLDAQTAPSLRPVINATGVIVHTNLGRAPLSRAALAAVQHTGVGYTNLEYDLEAGARGSRHDHVRRRLCRLTGADDALVVNNNAAAVYLVLSALCQGREVLIGRNELVEIGGGFRIPDVLRQSGAHLVEVGTTNRTHPHDFAQAITAQTAAIMRVHSSNFKQIGFVTKPEPAMLARIARDAGLERDEPIWFIDDLGSGTLLQTDAYGLAPEPTVQESLTAGADLVTFSGDKLLGGPQAGLIVGRAELVARLRRHPMARALRVDKMTLAALDATLAAYVRRRAPDEIPVWQMISASKDMLQERAAAWRKALLAHAPGRNPAAITILPAESTVGGGSLPGETLPTYVLAVAVTAPDAVAGYLRCRELPVVCRIQQDRLLFDPRTVLPDQDDELLQAIADVLVQETAPS